ncbi:MAG: hypothetical protein DDT41_01172 [candidate division WS2 bacterium]|nr:hypothetical protein [Candidatus Psychracetigena formicireducens]
MGKKKRKSDVKKKRNIRNREGQGKNKCGGKTNK